MSTVTLDAVVYDGKVWKNGSGQQDLLAGLGFRQVEVYDARYGSRIELRSPIPGPRSLNVVVKGTTIVFDGGNLVAVMPGDRLDRPAPKPEPVKKAAKAKKATKKAA